MRENGDEASVSPSVGEFVRKQRQLADLSLRQMAELTQVSNAYLSQIERGLHQPSFACFGRSSTPSTFPRRPCSPRPGSSTPLMARRTPPPRQRPRTPRRQSGTTPPKNRRPRRVDPHLPEPSKATERLTEGLLGAPTNDTASRPGTSVDHHCRCLARARPIANMSTPGDHRAARQRGDEEQAAAGAERVERPGPTALVGRRGNTIHHSDLITLQCISPRR